tara:strand:- start:122 stop:649 length:528 start_codon:yes stop_codon:yes gene_type:complete
MSTKNTKRKLTQSERDEIIVLVTEENQTYATVAKRYGCSIPNISYLIKKHRAKNPVQQKKITSRSRAATKKTKTKYHYPTDPIDFRIAKLLEIEGDIIYARENKIIHTLGSLHKLHLNIHDEYRTFVSAAAETHGTTAEQLKIEIAEAIHALPPVLKKQVLDEILTDRKNVVRIK